MFTQAMSSAKKSRSKFSLCLHKRKFVFVLFHRAKPVSEMERSGIELHCGVTIYSEKERNRAALRSYNLQQPNPETTKQGGKEAP